MEESEDDAAEYREAEWLRNWTPLAVDYGEYDPLRAGSIDGTDTSPHDRGIIRAVRANCKTFIDPPNSQGRLSLHALDKPLKNVGSDPECTLFVGRINHDTTEDTLQAIFSECGKIKSLRLIRDIVTGRSKGYAFVEFSHPDNAEKAYDRCHKMNVDGYQLLVEFECGRTLPGWVPRRLGGGFGGKKESGQLRFGGRERPFRKPIVVGSKMLGSRGRERGSGVPRGDWRRGREAEGRDRGRDEREKWRYGRRDSMDQRPGQSGRERHVDRSPRRKKE
ncbi:U11/U12 small nuclear ribonucleoprotein 35 kDa protein [Geodia barretti]|uniref:U11/U12 small nuclear ribonucleoprotein 35 kDa protein n=1 Tax=Geodia barretti TaxID=519541 RepID=A0AA35T1L6_GEOBA|nr:U11/U12 small nuclear ribonucleoprotein 35 kDa protein [Geodia barretti]